MSKLKTVKDIMVDVFSYPHIPYWFSIRQAAGIVNVSLANKKYPNPIAVLVFDEKYNLVGTLSLKDILKGLEPKFLKPVAKAQVPEEDESGLSLLWESLIDSESEEKADQPVSGIMVPAKFHVAPADPVTKAAYLVIHNDLTLLPVIDNGKFVGLVRMIEIFDEISGVIINKQKGESS
ncbi:MAG: CBS domain-containing protein [Nitrospirota bacterium]|nr:CBS domain-containing protein [Nitrospirota bacterium]